MGDESVKRFIAMLDTRENANAADALARLSCGL